MQLGSIAGTEFIHPLPSELPPLIGDDLIRHATAWPLLWLNLYTILGTKFHFILCCICKARHHRPFSSFHPNINPSNQLGSCIDCQINIRSTDHAAAVQTGYQIDIRYGRIHLIASKLAAPVRCRTMQFSVISLVIRKALSCNDLLRLFVITVLIKVVLEPGPAWSIRRQAAIRLGKLFDQHHLISSSEGEPFGGIVERPDRPVIGLILCRFA